MTDLSQSWNDTPTRRAIIDFVARVTTDGGPGFVPVEERIAVFDNDGTLWTEKPMPVEVGFLLQRLAAMAEADASLRDQQPWQAAYTHDHAWLGGAITKHYQGDESDVRVLMGGILRAFDGMSVHEYQAASDAFLRGGQHPTLARPYTSVAFAPMVELLRFLEDHGFTTFIASGGDRDFMRAITAEMYGIPPERVIGSSNGLAYREVDGVGHVVYEAKPDVFDDGPVKPVRIWSRIGRRPIVAVGNSNGDIPMLTFAAHPDRPSLSVLVDHDDGDREVLYRAGAEESLERAKALGWTVVSMKHDWSTVFAD